MVYRIPTPGNVIPSEKGRTPRFLEAAIQQQAQANALREGKQRDKAAKLGAAVSLLGSATGTGGWLEALGMGADKMQDEQDIPTPEQDTMAQEGPAPGMEEGQMLAAEDEGMSDAEKVGAVASVASLASGNPMGLIGLKKLFDEYA